MFLTIHILELSIINTVFQSPNGVGVFLTIVDKVFDKSKEKFQSPNGVGVFLTLVHPFILTRHLKVSIT